MLGKNNFKTKPCILCEQLAHAPEDSAKISCLAMSTQWADELGTNLGQHQYWPSDLITATGT